MFQEQCFPIRKSPCEHFTVRFQLKRENQGEISLILDLSKQEKYNKKFYKKSLV